MRRALAVAFVLLLALAPATGPLVATTGAATAPPSGMVTVPDQAVSTNIPSHANGKIAGRAAWTGDTLASRHAETLSVEVTTESQVTGRASRCTAFDPPEWCSSPELVVQLTDDRNGDGRRVALPADAVEQSLGRVPDAVYGRNSETGERWTAPVTRSDGYVIFEVPHFSTNTVSFSSRIDILAQPATDGDTLTYDINDLDAADNFSIELTGADSTEWDNQSFGPFGGATDSKSGLSVAGNVDPARAEVEVTGIDTYQQQTDSFDGHALVIGADSNGNQHTFQQRYQNPPNVITQLSVRVAQQSTTPSGTVDIYISNGEPNSTVGDGVLVKENWTPPGEIGLTSIRFDTAFVPESNNITVEFVSSGFNAGDEGELAYDNTSPDIDGDNVLRIDGTETSNYAIRLRPQSDAAKNLTISDDLGNSVTIGDLSGGETVTKSIPLELASSDLEWSADYGAARVQVNIQERTETVDPVIEVNGHTTSYTGTLSDGQTTQLTTDTSWLQSGENTINISVGDGTLSSDAPTPTVAMNYSHEATDQQTVDYEAEAWSERYNVSKSWATQREQAALNISFERNVVAMRTIEYRVNGSTWMDMSSESYTLAGTDLRADLDAAYGGPIPPGTTIEVRANASRVQVHNGSLTVVQATAVGSSLDTKFELQEWNSDSYIGVGGTAEANRVHYTYSESWSNVEEQVTVYTNGSQRWHAPNADTGSTARMRTLPLEVTPETTDVRLEVVDADATPELQVRPGEVAGELVTYRYLDTTSGSTYILYSKSAEVQRDSAEAQSPVELVDDDSSELLLIRENDETSSTGGTGGGGGGGGPIIAPPPDASENAPILVAVGVALFAVVAFASFRYLDPGRPRQVVLVGTAGLELVVGALALRPALVVRPIAEGIGSVVPLLALGAGALVLFGGWRFIQRRTAPEEPTQVTIDANTGGDSD